MKATVNAPQSWKRILQVEIPEADFDKRFGEELSTVRKNLSLPGFRQGKVPQPLIKSRYGTALRAEVIEKLVQKAFEETCKEHNINPICQGRISDLKADAGAPLTFTLETEVDPEVTIAGYEKLKIKAAPKKIGKSEVDEAIEELRGRLAEFKDVERAAKKGDHIMFEYESVVIDGAKRSDFTNPKYPVELGTSKLKDFEKGLIGTKAGETAQFDLKFPKDYESEELSGKKGDFSIKVLKVQEKILPEVNAGFVKKLGDFADEQALRDHIQKDLDTREIERARNEAYGKAIDQIIKDNDFEVPPTRVDNYIDYMIEETAKYRRPGEPVPSREEFAQKYHDVGIKAIKRFRIIDAIATKEKIKASQDEVDLEIKKIADQYHQPFEQVKQAFRKNGTTTRIRGDLREQKTLNFLIGEYVPPAQPVSGTDGDATDSEA